MQRYETLTFMSGPRKFRALYSDIGGVLGTNGWDSGVRARLCSRFEIDPTEIDGRHRLMFDTYERGFITFKEYLRRVFFAVERPFTVEDVAAFAYDQSQPWPANIAFLKQISKQNNLKLALISNEGEGITQHRIQKFGLRELADFMVISHCVHLRKPDPAIWHLALDLAGLHAQDSIYIDDRPLFADVAIGLGFASIHHTSLENTREKLSSFGLEC